MCTAWTVPTGGGKRCPVWLWRLHALRHGKRQVVLTIPYTSIIEQTAGIFRSVSATKTSSSTTAMSRSMSEQETAALAWPAKPGCAVDRHDQCAIPWKACSPAVPRAAANCTMRRQRHCARRGAIAASALSAAGGRTCCACWSGLRRDAGAVHATRADAGKPQRFDLAGAANCAASRPAKSVKSSMTWLGCTARWSGSRFICRLT